MDNSTQKFPYQRVTVTGGAGFLGRFVVQKLKKLDVEVFVPRSSDYNLIEKDDIVRLLNETRPDLVIHLAAVVGGIGYNQKNPGRFFYDNLMMGVQLKMMLVQSQAYRQQYGFNSIFLLPANLYGPGDNFDLETSHVIPALIRKCVEARREGKPFIEAWGSGEVSREFLYVEDCAEALVRAAAVYNESEPVNIGTGNEVMIKDLVKMIARVSDFHGEIRWQASKPDGQPRRRLETGRSTPPPAGGDASTGEIWVQRDHFVGRRFATHDRMVRRRL